LEPYLLAYLFVAFASGIACMGALLILARRPDAELTRRFLLFYGALTILVVGRLLLAWASTVGSPTGSGLFALQYVESFVGRYGVLFTLPLFGHALFRVAGGRRDAIAGGVAVAAFALQHVTEFGLGGVWDEPGDVAEDVLSAAVVAYTLWLGFRRRTAPGVPRPLADRFLALVVIALPGIAYDLFLSDAGPWRFYPLWYGVLSVVLTVSLHQNRPSAGAPIPSSWELSAREREVMALVRRGLSNREIARELVISTNTVKTHLRAIFDKTGYRSRVRLVAALGRDPEGRSGDDHPDG
jgi:DNA-binding CsgD family transcriptional regulator